MQMLYLCGMGIFSSKCADSRVVQQSAPSLLSELGSIIAALYALQTSKIEVASDMACDAMLMAPTFDDMCKARLKLKEEIECIQSETEEQILKYQAKAKSISQM
jgi:hypothetical protein